MFRWDEEKKRRWGIPLIINTMLLMILAICLNGCSKQEAEAHTDGHLKNSYAISDTPENPSSTADYSDGIYQNVQLEDYVRAD